MTFSTSDLTPLLQSAPTAQMRYASGTIISWNAETFESVVEVRGSQLVNLPVLAGPDALTYKTGDVVALVGADQAGTRGIASYAILGRFVVPGAGRARDAIDWMTSELGRQIAASVFADRIRSDYVGETADVAGDFTWRDATFAGRPSPGPAVELDITSRGAAIVIISARLGGSDAASFDLGCAITGATEVDASSSNAASFSNHEAQWVSTTAAAVTYFSGLNPGTHRFVCKYRKSDNASGGGLANAAQRSLTVIGF